MLPERIAVDATALISASIRGRALRVFLKAPIVEFATTAFNFSETTQHLPRICQKRGMGLAFAEMILHSLPIRIYPKEHYQGSLQQAYRIIGKRDKNDVELLALALEEQLPIWSEDNDFQAREIKKLTMVYTTSELLKVL